MLFMRQRFGDLFLSGSRLQFRHNMIKVNFGSKSWLLTCSSNITLILPSLYFSELKRELNFCNGYLSLMYFWMEVWEFQCQNLRHHPNHHQKKGMFQFSEGLGVICMTRVRVLRHFHLACLLSSLDRAASSQLHNGAKHFISLLLNFSQIFNFM